MACKDCGIFDKEKIYCYRYKKEIPEKEQVHKEDCPYFYKTKTEGGEPYSPQEHLMFQENEQKNKKMRGPV